MLTDFTPNLLLIALQNRYNHLLQKALELESGRKLNVERLGQILTVLKDETIYAGLLSGTLDNEDEIKEVLVKHNIELMTPTEAIDRVISEIE